MMFLRTWDAGALSEGSGAGAKVKLAVNHLQMNSREEIRQAFEDYQLGRMGGLTL